MCTEKRAEQTTKRRHITGEQVRDLLASTIASTAGGVLLGSSIAGGPGTVIGGVVCATATIALKYMDWHLHQPPKKVDSLPDGSDS